MSLLNFINKGQLPAHVPQDSQLYVLLDRDQPDSPSWEHIVQAADYFRDMVYDRSRIVHIVSEVQVFVGYVCAKLAVFVPRLLNGMKQEYNHPQQQAIEKLTHQCLKAVNDVLRKLRGIFCKYDPSTNLSDLSYVRDLLVVSDYIPLRYEIMRLLSVVDVQLPGDFSVCHGELLIYDQVSIAVSNHTGNYQKIKPSFRKYPEFHKKLQFAKVKFVVNCYQSIAKHIEQHSQDFNDSDIGELACYYRLYLNLSSSNQATRESVLIEHLLWKRDRQENAEWLFWNLEELDGVLSKQTIEALRELYKPHPRLSYDTIDEHAFSILRNRIEQAQKKFTMEEGVINQDYFRDLTQAIQLTSWARQHTPSQHWLIRARLKFQQCLFKLLTKLWKEEPTDVINLQDLRQLFVETTFSDGPQKQQLFLIICNVKNWHAHHYRMGLTLLIQDVFRNTFQEMLKDANWKNWLYANNTYLFGLLLKLSSFKLDFSIEQQQALQLVLREKKVTLFTTAIKDAVQYYYPKGLLQEEIKEYLQAKLFQLPLRRSIYDTECNVFTPMEKIGLFAEPIEKCKSQHRQTQRCIMEKYSNPELRIQLLASCEEIINVLVDSAFGSTINCKTEEELAEVFLARLRLSRGTIYLYKYYGCDSSKLLFGHLGNVYQSVLEDRPHTDILTTILARQHKEGVFPQHQLFRLFCGEVANGNITYEQASQELVIYPFVSEFENYSNQQKELNTHYPLDSIVSTMSYLMQEYELEFSSRLTEYITRSFGASDSTRKQTIDAEFEFMSQASSLRDLFCGEFRRSFDLAHCYGVSYDTNLSKQGYLARWTISYNLPQLMGMDELKDKLFEKLHSTVDAYEVQYTTKTCDYEIFLHCVEQIVKVKGYVVDSVQADVLLMLKILDAMLRSLAPYQRQAMDSEGYNLLSSLKDFVVDYVKGLNPENFLQKILTRQQLDLYLRIYTNTMRLNGFSESFFEDFYNGVATYQRKKAKLEKNGKELPKEGFIKEFGSDDLKKYVEGFVEQLQYPASAKHVKQIYETMKKVKLNWESIRSKLEAVIGELENNTSSKDYSLRKHINALLLKRLLPDKKEVQSINEQILKLMGGTGFVEIDYDLDLLEVVRQTQNTELLCMLRSNIEPVLNDLITVTAADSLSRRRLAWSLLLYLNSQTASTALQVEITPRYFTEILLSKDNTKSSCFSIFDVLFLEQLQHLTTNLKLALKMETLQFLLENFYDTRRIEHLTLEMILAQALKLHRNEIIKRMRQPYKCFSAQLENVCDTIIAEGSFSQSAETSLPVEFYWRVVNTPRKKLTEEDFAHTAFINTLPYFPETVRVLLAAHPPKEVIGNVQQTAPMLLVVCNSVLWTMPDYYFELITVLCQSAVTTTNQELETILELLRFYSQRLMQAALPFTFQQIQTCHKILKQTCCKLVGARVDLSYEKLNKLRQSQHFSKIVNMLSILDRDIKLYGRYGVVLGEVQVDSNLMNNLYEGEEKPNESVLSSQAYFRQLGSSWSEQPVVAGRARNFSDLSKWLASEVSKDSSPDEIYEQAKKERQTNSEPEAEEKQEQQDSVDVEEEEEEVYFNENDPVARELKYSTLSEQRQKKYLVAIFENFNRTSLSGEELMGSLKYDVQELLRVKDLQEFIEDLTEKEMDARRKSYKRVIDMVERYTLDCKEPIDEKFVLEFVKDNYQLANMDNSQFLKQIALGRLPKQLRGAEQMQQTMDMLNEKYGYFFPSNELQWFESEDKYYERQEQLKKELSEIEYTIEDNKKRKEDVRIPEPEKQEQTSEPPQEEQKEQQDEQEEQKEQQDEQEEQKEEQDEQGKTEKKPQQQEEKVVPTKQPPETQEVKEVKPQAVAALEIAKSVFETLLKSKQFMQRNISELPDELVVFQLFCCIQNYDSFEPINIQQRLRLLSLMWRLAVAAILGTDKETLLLFRNDSTPEEDLVQKLVERSCSSSLFIRELDNVSISYTMSLYNLLNSETSPGQIKPNTTVTVEFTPVTYLKLQEQPKFAITELLRLTKNKIYFKQVSNFASQYMFNGVGNCQGTFRSTSGVVEVGQRILANISEWVGEAPSWEYIVEATNLLSEDYRQNMLKTYLSSENMLLLYETITRNVLEFFIRKIKELLSLVDQCKSEGLDGYDIIELYDPEKHYVDANLISNLASGDEFFSEAMVKISEWPLFWDYAELQIQAYLVYYEGAIDKDDAFSLSLDGLFKIANSQAGVYLKNRVKETVSKETIKKRLTFTEKPQQTSLITTTNPYLIERINRFDALLQKFRHDSKLKEKVHDLKAFLTVSTTKSLPAEKLEALRDFIQTNGGSLTVELDRRALWLSTVKFFLEKTPKEIFEGNYDVSFHDEEGIDGGGPHNEWILKVLEEVQQPARGLFAETTERYLLPSAAGKAVLAYRLHYRVFGRLLAKFLYGNEVVRSFPLCPYIWKLLKGQPVGLDDMKDVDILTQKNLTWILDHEVGEDLDLTFSVELEQGLGASQTYNLVEKGDKILVNNTNKHEYVRKLVEWRLVESIKDQLYEFMLGFLQIFPQSLLDYFTVQELQQLTTSRERFDVDEYRRDVNYKNCNAATNEVVWLFEILKEFSNEELERYTEFISGRRRLPVGRFKEFSIYMECKLGILPYSSTCSCKLMMGIAKDKQQLRKKLWQAMNECEGFHRA